MAHRRPRVVLAGLLLFSLPSFAQLIERGGKIAGAGATSEAARQGASVSLSADGTTAIEGGPYDGSGRGAVWVFARTGAGWAQQGERLAANDSVGERVFQGRSVALSADGNTALVGGDGDDGGIGAAWVFTRVAGAWAQQAKLIGDVAVGQSRQGSAVALSADGNTALVGGASDDNGAGAAWVFTRAGAAWTQQGRKLVGSSTVGTAQQGSAVALSADGNTALVGGPADASNQGAAWIFTRSGDVWTQQGDKLAGAGGLGPAIFQGHGLALSGDGNNAVIGGYGDNRNSGAAWVFARSGDTWAQVGEKLTVPRTPGAQVGYAVALSADGNRLLLGGPTRADEAGAAWEFARENGAWAEVGELAGRDSIGKAQQGYAVAMAADGHTALLGGMLDSVSDGAVWTFADPVLTISAPAAVTAGEPATLTVALQDGVGNPVPSYPATVHLTSSDAQAGLPIDAPLTNGMATFSVTLKTSGTQTIAATARSNLTAVSNPVAVSAGRPVRFLLDAPGAAITGKEVLVSATPVDRYNNPAAYEGSVRWSSSDPLAQPSPATRLHAAVILRTPGKQTITVEGAGNASLTGRATIILASSSQPIDYVTTVLSTNPTAYFRLQAANDTSQVNGYTSAFQPGATLATGGAPICDPNNQSVSLDGNTGLVTTSLNWRDINGPVSVAAWVNQSVPSTSAWVAGFGAVTVPDVGWSGYYYLEFFGSRDDITFYVPPNAPVVDFILSASPVGNWHMAAGTYDPTVKTATLYWDGLPVGAAKNVAAVTPTNGQFSIGAIGPPCTEAAILCQHFSGAIDEVAVWNYPLTAAQVSQIYASAACPTPVTDNETVHVTDTESLLLSLLITDNETIHVTDTPTLPFEPVTVSVNPPLAGTVTAGGGLFEYLPGATATITATANPGYAFANFSGSLPTTSANPLIVTVNGPLNIVANFTPLEPALKAAVTGARTDGPVPGTRNVPVTITNAGLGAALNAQISAVTTTVLNGSLTRVTLASGVPSTPVTLAPGASTTLPLVFDWPLSATRVSMKFELIATDASGNSYSATQTVTLFR
jgi:Concanavalin A-like lectin/glucanases superfamily/Divergent InlB B-repeat domain